MFIIWLITSRCNLNCSHCYVKGRDLGQELPPNEALTLAEKIVELGADSVNITGGEPLLRRDLFKIIDYFREHGLRVSVFSNLTLLTEKIARNLARREITIYTSIDGARPETHELIRGRGTWHPTMKGIRMLIDLGVTVRSCFTITKYNYRETGDYLVFSRDLGVDYMSLIPVIPSTKRARNAMPSNKQVYEAIKLAENTAKNEDIYASIWCAPFAGLYVSDKHLYIGKCPAYTTLDVGPDGRVLLCDTLDLTIGNILTDKPDKIIEDYKHHPLEARSPIPIACNNCAIKMDCQGGCIARRLLLKNLDYRDPLCSSFQYNDFLKNAG